MAWCHPSKILKLFLTTRRYCCHHVAVCHTSVLYQNGQRCHWTFFSSL